jgi:hypothetical protein
VGGKLSPKAGKKRSFLLESSLSSFLFTYTVALYTTGMVERRDGATPPDNVPRAREDNEVTEKAETEVDSARLSSDSAIFIVRGSS